MHFLITILRNAFSKIKLFAAFWLLPMIAFAQTAPPTPQDCLGAIPLCKLQYTEPDPYQYSGNGTYSNEITQTNECITAEVNGVWYIFTAETSGVFKFHLRPNDLNDDYDWTMFNITKATCADLKTDVNKYLVSSNTWGDGANAYQGSTGADSDSTGTLSSCNGPGTDKGPKWNRDISVIQGQTYILYVSNFSASKRGYAIDFSKSTASITDNTGPAFSYVAEDIIDCGTTDIKFSLSERVLSSAISTKTFAVTGSTGIFYADKISGQAFSTGGLYERDFVLHFNNSLPPGNYSLINAENITDACGNNFIPGNLPFVVKPVNIEITSKQELLCNYSTGSITVAGTLDVDIVNYELSGTAEKKSTTGVFDNLKSGNYQVRGLNAFNCASEPINFSFTQPPPIEFNTETVAVTSCFGRSEGEIKIKPEGFAFGYEFSINDGTSFETNSTYNNLPAGKYTLLIKNSLGCISDKTEVTLAQPDEIKAETGFEPIVCHNDSNGVIKITASGGTGNLRYFLNDSTNLTGIFENLGKGTYTPVVLDINNCTKLNPDIKLENPEAVNFSTFKYLGIPCHIENNAGQLEIEASGGTGEISLYLNKQKQQNFTFDELPIGGYSVYLLDENLCSSEDTLQFEILLLPCITVPPVFTPNGDGIGDTWVIENIEAYPQATVEIYDRYGKKVFENHGTIEPWNGTNSGTLLPADTYYYYITFNDGTRATGGSVLLIR